MDKKLLIRSATLFLGTVAALQITCSSAWAMQELPRQLSLKAIISKREMLNSRCIVPSFGNAPDYFVQLKNGEYKFKVNNSTNQYEEGSLSHTASGVINKQPIGVGLLFWNTGGSGTWNTFILFKRVKGKVKSVGHNAIGYSCGQVKNMRIEGGKVMLDSLEMRADLKNTTNDVGAIDEGNKVKPIEPAQIMQATVSIPFNAFGGDVEEIPTRIAVGRVMRKEIPAPLVVFFQFRRYEGKICCDAFYNLGNEYSVNHVSNVRVERDKVIFDGRGIAIRMSQFQKPRS